MRRRWLDAATVFLFLGGVAAPGVDERLRPDSARDPTPEMRRAEPRPVVPADLPQWMSWPARFEAHYDDTFGLRDQLLRERSRWLWLGLGESPAPQILMGKDGWIFFGGAHSAELMRGLLPFRPSELDEWVAWLEGNRARLARRGVRYVYVVAPDKQTIYPEMVPSGLNPVGPTRFDQLLDAVRARTTVEIVDVRPALRAEKAFDRPGDYVYFQGGTHWTRRGAWAATQPILAALRKSFPAIRPRPRTDHVLTKLPSRADDNWATSMYIGDLIEFPVWEFAPREGTRAPSLALDLSDHGDRLTSIDDADLPSVVLVHDSFGPFLQPHLSEHCRRLHCTWQYTVPAEMVEREHPEIVVQLYVERSLATEPMPQQQGVEILSRADFEAHAHVAWKLDAAGAGLQVEGATRIEPVEDVGGRGIALEFTSPRDRIDLSSVSVPVGVAPCVHLSITCPTQIALEIWYTTQDDPEFTRRHGAIIPLSAGPNELFFTLPVTDFGGRMSLRPEGGPGRYLLRAFEIRH